MEVLILGDGLLGSELQRQTGWNCVSRKKGNLDVNNWHFRIITSPDDELYELDEETHLNTSKYDVIINCVANTNTYSDNKDEHWNVNYKFVDKLIKYCNGYHIKLVHISTDYIYAGSDSNATEETVPVHHNSWYSYTKLLSDGLVQLNSEKYLICRCSHKPKPFPYDKAWDDQLTNADYVDVIVSLIINGVEKDLLGVYNIGTEVKTIHKLVKDSTPINSPDNAPKDVTMNINKFNRDIK